MTSPFLLPPEYYDGLAQAIIDDCIELTPEEAERDYPVLWNVAEKLFPQFDASGLATVVSLMVGVCPACHERALPCYCLDDE